MQGCATLSPRPRPIVFKRWSRRPYAAFCSLHREVVIGVVKASIADAQMLKMGRKTRIRQCPATHTDKTADDGDDPPPNSLTATAAATQPAATDAPARTAHRRTGRGGVTTENDNKRTPHRASPKRGEPARGSGVFPHTLKTIKTQQKE